MKTRTVLLLPALLLCYLTAFWQQEKLFHNRETTLSFAPAAAFLRIASGYWQQLAAEILFVKSAVFLGGVKAGADPRSYAPALAHNYQQITSIYPEFIDPYYFTQTFLPSVSKDSAEAANAILATGIGTYPNDFVLRLFLGINYLNYLNDPLQAAEVFQEASQRPQAPPMFAHLAAIMAVKGGNLQAGLLSLKVLHDNEENEAVRQRYGEEIALFEKAISLYQAALRYEQETGSFPADPKQLLPVYIPVLPDFMPHFQLVWEPPQVKLRRPEPKELQEYQNSSTASPAVPFL